jgi:hypothetical protein
VKTHGTKNVAASVRQRLLNKARESGRPFGEVLQYFAMERFLYRLCKSKHADRFILKGALMLAVWDAPIFRPTKDIDLLGRADNDVDAIAAFAKDICLMRVTPDDGVTFDASSVHAERIAEAAEYEGVRVHFVGTLDRARIHMQLDIGFGDAVLPRPLQINYPTILDFPAPRLRGYPRESAIAEKFEAMVKLGELNSRMKDFFDIWLLSRSFDFDGAQLRKAILKTFETRGTPLPEGVPVALTEGFGYEAHALAQWRAFVGRTKLRGVPEFPDLIAALRAFLLPLLAPRIAGEKGRMNWAAGGTNWSE